VLVVIYTPGLQILLLERADHPGYWQSVTGSQHEGETLLETAVREVSEETAFSVTAAQLEDWGIETVFEIYAQWRHRYAPGVTHNTEHVFGLRVDAPFPVQLAAREHLRFAWVPCRQAARQVFSPSNAEAILKLCP
jgi:dATP pyrophosphohydrolase